MNKTKKVFSKEFKLQAVELSHVRKSVTEVAFELGIYPGTLQRWKKEFSGNVLGTAVRIQTREEEEILLLKKKIAGSTIRT